MVSVEPTQTEAARPTKLSAPYRVSVSPRSAREALPEKGRSKISGVSSEGMPIFSKTGESQLPRASSAPHPRRSVIAPSIAARAGKTRRSVGTASAAPRIKASYGFTRRIRAYASSAATYGDGSQGFDDKADIDNYLPLNGYGYSKQLFDIWVKKELAAGNKAPRQHAGLKFFNVYGPNEYFKGSMASVIMHGFNQIKERGYIGLFKSYKEGYEDGGQLRDFVYVKDVCNVMMFLT